MLGKRNINNKQTVFVNEYLKDFNATRAATVAGYSAKTSYSIGNRLLKYGHISDAINKEMLNHVPKVPGCLYGHGKYKKSTYVYLFREDFSGLVKIGIARDPIKRMGEIQITCPQNITIVGYINTQNACEIETVLHSRYSNKHFRGEWFRLTDGDVEDIKEEWQNQRQFTVGEVK